jgi:hypothetical protein
MEVAQKGEQKGDGSICSSPSPDHPHVRCRRLDFRLVLALCLVCLLGGLTREQSAFDARCQVLVPTLARVV